MTDEAQPDKDSRRKSLSLGIALGAGIGTAIGVATDNLAVWLPIRDRNWRCDWGATLARRRRDGRRLTSKRRPSERVIAPLCHLFPRAATQYGEAPNPGAR